jgi:allantoin racemase
MKLLVINPNISEGITNAAVAAAQAAAQPGTNIRGETGAFGVAYIATRGENIIGAHAALTAFAEATSREEFDGVIVAAFSDPGLEAIRELSACPVVGMAQAGMEAAAKFGRFAIVTAAPALLGVMEERAFDYGVADRCAGVVSAPQGAVNLAGDLQGAVSLLVQLAQTAINERGAQAIILGGAPLAAIADAIRVRLPVPVIEGVTAAVKHLQAVPVHRATTTPLRVKSLKPARGVSPSLASLLGVALKDSSPR